MKLLIIAMLLISVGLALWARGDPYLTQPTIPIDTNGVDEWEWKADHLLSLMGSGMVILGGVMAMKPEWIRQKWRRLQYKMARFFLYFIPIWDWGDDDEGSDN